MNDTGLPNIYSPLDSPLSFAGWLIQSTQTGFHAFFGTPSPAEIQAGADKVRQTVAQAGGSPAEQSAAAAEYERQIPAATKTFDQLSPISNVVQRAFDAGVSGTTDVADVIPVGTLAAISDGSSAVTLLIVAGLFFALWYVLQEVL